MFTGIIEEKGSIKQIDMSDLSGSLRIKAGLVTEDAKVGDSICVNGVCLTVTSLTNDGFCADVMAETVRQTSLSGLSSGSFVNLERAMPMNGRFGGHIVSGHIDGIGQIVEMKKEGNATWISVKADPGILRYIVERGSIAIDGMSLTVAYVDESIFKVSIIPHTAENTTILGHTPGDIVNLETDIIAKYVEKLMARKGEESSDGSDLTLEYLISEGF